MAQVTVQQLAETVGASVDRLLTQMKEAGLPHSGAEQDVSEEDKHLCVSCHFSQVFASIFHIVDASDRRPD